MQNSWPVLLPPLLVIICAHKTKNILLSLLIGILSAGLIAYDFSLIKALTSLINKLWATTELSSMTSWETGINASAPFICCFLLAISILTTLLHRSGGAFAYASCIKKRLNKAWQAEAATFGLSLSLFVDDYFSTLTVGSVMKSVTDLFKIPRVKLAWLANTVAAPLSILTPVSSWVAEIVLNMNRSGITETASDALVKADPFSLYLRLIPFFFYSFLVLIIISYFIYRRQSVALIKKHEAIAAATGNLFGGKTEIQLDTQNHSEHNKASLIDFVFPMGILFGSVFIMMLYLGNYTAFGGAESLMFALQKTPKAACLCLGALISIVFSTIFLLFRKKITSNQIIPIYSEGFCLMYQSVIFLLLIWTFSSLLRSELATGQYIASFLSSNTSLALLPAVFFIIAIIIGTLMGTAWGTMGILIPIATEMVVSLSALPTPVLIDQLPMLLPLLGAVISGSVIANHLSPISDTLLMSTKSSQAYYADVVKAQAQFTLPLIGATTLSYICAGFLIIKVSMLATLLCSLGVGVVASLLLLRFTS